jgi:hypothetical protein
MARTFQVSWLGISPGIVAVHPAASAVSTYILHCSKKAATAPENAALTGQKCITINELPQQCCNNCCVNTVQHFCSKCTKSG